MPFTAATRNVYAVPFVKPVTVLVVAVDGMRSPFESETLRYEIHSRILPLSISELANPKAGETRPSRITSPEETLIDRRM
jgi:hypothetical protein